MMISASTSNNREYTTITVDKPILVSKKALENIADARKLGNVVLELGTDRVLEVYHLITSTAIKHIEEQLRDYECLKLSLEDDLK